MDAFNLTHKGWQRRNDNKTMSSIDAASLSFSLSLTPCCSLLLSIPLSFSPPLVPLSFFLNLSFFSFSLLFLLFHSSFLLSHPLLFLFPSFSTHLISLSHPLLFLFPSFSIPLVPLSISSCLHPLSGPSHPVSSLSLSFFLTLSRSLFLSLSSFLSLSLSDSDFCPRFLLFTLPTCTNKR